MLRGIERRWIFEIGYNVLGIWGRSESAHLDADGDLPEPDYYK